MYLFYHNLKSFSENTNKVLFVQKCLVNIVPVRRSTRIKSKKPKRKLPDYETISSMLDSMNNQVLINIKQYYKLEFFS